MKVRKAIKKIAALAAGASMVGATILGAMAGLGDYPEPFVKDGIFDAVITVGGEGGIPDVVGAVDIGASLQFEMRQEQSVSIGGSEVSISEGVRIDKPGVDFNYYDEIADIDPRLTDEDLPVILADGEYKDNEGETDNEESYTQKLEFAPGNADVTFEEDSEDEEEPADTYLHLDTTLLYTFTLDFDNPVDWDGVEGFDQDVENTMISIQGNDYTVTQGDDDGAGEVTELTLMAGDTVIWMQQGKTLTRMISGSEHEIEVVDVNDQEDMCGIAVDGDIVWIDRGDSAEINGIEIGVTDAVAVHAQLQDTDICKVNLGAEEIFLEDGQEVKVGGDEIEGSEAMFNLPAVPLGANEWYGIVIEYTPDEDVFIAAGESWQDPVLGNFEISFGGMTRVDETITLDVSGDKGTLNFVNNDGDEVEIPIIYEDAGDVIFGDDYEFAQFVTTNYPTLAATPGEAMFLYNGDMCDASGGDDSVCDDILMLVVSDGEEARVVEVTDIDWSVGDERVDLRDKTTGKTWKDRIADGVTPIDLGFTQITLDATGGMTLVATDITQADTTGLVGDGTSLMATSNNAVIELNPQVDLVVNTLDIVVYENYDSDLGWAAGQTEIVMHVEEEAVGLDELEVNDPTSAGDYAAADANLQLVDISESSDVQRGATTWGTIVEYDTDGADMTELTYPEEAAEANVFISPVGAQILGAAGGDLSTVTIDKINVGAAKLDSEVAGQEKSQNMIIVGGPCINGAARAIMGLTKDNCLEGAEEGKAVIKLYENGGNVAMLVSGYSADDTRRATRVVANYDSSAWADKFMGSEIVVTGTSLTDITVSAPQ